MERNIPMRQHQVQKQGDAKLNHKLLKYLIGMVLVMCILVSPTVLAKFADSKHLHTSARPAKFDIRITGMDQNRQPLEKGGNQLTFWAGWGQEYVFTVENHSEIPVSCRVKAELEDETVPIAVQISNLQLVPYLDNTIHLQAGEIIDLLVTVYADQSAVIAPVATQMDLVFLVEQQEILREEKP